MVTANIIRHPPADAIVSRYDIVDLTTWLRRRRDKSFYGERLDGCDRRNVCRDHERVGDGGWLCIFRDHNRRLHGRLGGGGRWIDQGDHPRQLIGTPKGRAILSQKKTGDHRH